MRLEPGTRLEMLCFRAEGITLREDAIRRGDLKMAGEFAEGISAIDAVLDDPNNETALRMLATFLELMGN